MSLRYATRICMRSLHTLKDRTSSSTAMLSKPGKPTCQMKPASETSSGNTQQVRWVSSSGDGVKKVGEKAEESRRLQEAEKAERVMHLICWGPHLS
ncbi:hypothetical protein SAY86_023667 [Trapa natans]|uniref:Uncharacterized protein n=1 Tax=Trapa natans TaxID=22666 RepID=A0AAN7R836_TRANT|nr:hypothetical protein SAY86_023667 [Trapa natans]